MLKKRDGDKVKERNYTSSISGINSRAIILQCAGHTLYTSPSHLYYNVYCTVHCPAISLSQKRNAVQ